MNKKSKLFKLLSKKLMKRLKRFLMINAKHIKITSHLLKIQSQLEDY
jgi:hypothetical protein